MPTLRVYVTLVLCTIILFSCNYKKAQSNTVATVTSNVDTAKLKADENTSLSEYSAAFIENAAQKFIVAPQKISVITADKGLRVTVDPAALQKADGSAVNGKIEVRIIELTTSEELFKSNAATVSNGRLMASGGSYFIGMQSDGQKLQLKKGNHLQVDFPKLKDAEMELFYGSRDSLGDMNWIKAAQPLIFNTDMDYAGFKLPYPEAKGRHQYKSKFALYESVNSKVIFGEKELTIKELVSLLQKRGIDKDIDSVFLDYDEAIYNGFLINDYRYSTYRYKMYRVISCKEQEAEKDSIAKEEKMRGERIAANSKYEEEWGKQNEENSLTGRLKKYYAPSAVTKLGWINCDRFNNDQQKTDVQIEIPITLSNPQIDYFIIYKSFNGLMNGRLLNNTGKQQYVLSNLPVGQAVTIVAFTKNNGQLFQCKEDFVIATRQTVKLDFKNISAAEMNTMFGKNVRI